MSSAFTPARESGPAAEPLLVRTSGTEAVASRVAVIGDVAGHLEELREELQRLGADPRTGKLPPGLVVIQVGDLVHRGPHSEEVVALVDQYLNSQPDQWIQLVGNHEAQYLNEPVFAWPERLSEQVAITIRRWWGERRMQVAVSVTGPTGDFLITHAGLTAGFWAEVVGAPDTAAGAAQALNALPGASGSVVFRPGHMLGGGRRSLKAGPLWAASATELVPSWLDKSLPFSQVHGHTSVYDWQRRAFCCRTDITRRASIDEVAKHAVVHLANGDLVGVDPGHAARPRRPWRGFEIAT